METKKYSSFAEIERHMEILKLEKEINYHKLILSIEKTKECLEPRHILSGFLGSYKSLLYSSYGSILKVAILYLTKWFLNRKRGN
ncbi:DUF6327 family protein [Flavobacterium sp.]|uniref:DUF6327 family protein n=1 Tax=Flavobacterium sp. TaxID=239 RepID=UPI0025EA80E4|nr:DUF6327 family protein [Flavobacterium sp.]